MKSKLRRDREWAEVHNKVFRRFALTVAVACLIILVAAAVVAR